MYFQLPTLLLAVTLSPQTDVVDSLVEAREAAFAAWVNDSVEESVSSLAVAIRSAADELSTLPAGEPAMRLASELELSLIRLQTFASATNNPMLLTDCLGDVEIPAQYGGAHARLAWLFEDCGKRLSTLVDWEFVGPFDNERGAGMETPLPPLSRPVEAEYAGKVRLVSWRKTPPFAPRRGRLYFSQLLDPTTQVCVLSRSWIESETDATVILQVGFEDELRVWLNGTPVFEALGEHEFARDAFGVRLSLVEGWNELTILVGAREGSPSFCARLTEPESGAPLSLPQTNSLPEGKEPFVLQSEGLDESLAVTPPGVRRVLGVGDSGQEALTRSWLEAYFRAAPVSRRPGRASAAAAVALEPNDLAARVQHAILLQDSQSSAEQDVNPWLHAVDEVLALAPRSAWAWRQRAYHAGWNQPTYDRALEQVDRALEGNPNSMLAIEMKVLLLEHLQQHALANRLREEMLAHTNIGVWPGLAQTASSHLHDGDPRHLDIDLAYFQATGSLEALRSYVRRASRAMEADDPALVERPLQMRLERTPWSVDARLDAARDYLTLGDTERALTLVEDAENLAPDRAAVQFWRARAFLQSEETDLAIAALERELELDFSSTDEQRLLEHLRTSGSTPFHESFREPLLDIISRVTIDPAAAASLPSREVILKRVVVKVNPDGTAQRYYRSIERILSEAGARDRDVVRFSSFPNQEIRVLQADVVDIEGKVSHARTGRTAGRMVVDLPPLKIGDVIDLEWRLDDVRQTFFGNYFGFNESFSSSPSVPVHESQIVIITPESFPLQFHTKGNVGEPVVSKDDAGQTQTSWTVKAIAPIKPERFMPPVEEELAAVQASSYPSWNAFGAWWWNLIEEEIRVSPEMAAKVAELTQGKESPLERLRAIYDFVVTDIRYNAWEFGVHGYQPYEAPVIFSRGFGDCKDKAILLRAMLGEAEIEAWPVLIRAEQRRLEEDLELALVEHFNHCIAYVPAQEGLPEMFLDGTARHHPLDVLPAMDNGAKVLIVRDKSIEQRRIPVATAEKNHVDSHLTVSVHEDRSADVELRRNSKGRFDPADRGRFSGSEEQRKEQAQAIVVSLLGPIEGEVATTFSDLDNLEEPVSVEFKVRAKQVARPTDNGFELPVVVSKFELQKSIAAETERETDLLLDVPRSNSTVIHYRLPPGSQSGALPESVHVENEDASYDWSAKLVEDGIEVREEFAIRTNRIPKERYPEFRELASKVDEAQSAMLEVEVKP